MDFPRTALKAVADLSKVLGSLGVVISILVASGGAWWYFQSEDLRSERWYADDTRWNEAILNDLEEMKAQLYMLENQTGIAIEHQTETLLAGQGKAAQTLTGAIFHLGIHQGQHLSNGCE